MKGDIDGERGLKQHCEGGVQVGKFSPPGANGVYLALQCRSHRDHDTHLERDRPIRLDLWTWYP